MVFNTALAATGHENHFGDASFHRLFDGVLNEWLVHHAQHFLGTGFGGGQKACAQTRNGKNSFSHDGHGVP